jgi:hypothetical protein
VVTSFGQLSLGVFWAGKTWGIQRRKTWWKLAANKLPNSIISLTSPFFLNHQTFQISYSQRVHVEVMSYASVGV